MSDRKNESEDIETAQKNQKKIGAAENDPETSGPAETYGKKQSIWLMKKKNQVSLLNPFIF
jgi:hypothetical protein